LDAIAWCGAEKRTFLKQRLQSRLASLYVKLKQYTDALPLIQKLIRDVKKFDDKLLLVEIFLVESRAHLALQNGPSFILLDCSCIFPGSTYAVVRTVL
jgi:26S proteasome regulatory subunit N6